MSCLVSSGGPWAKGRLREDGFHHEHAVTVGWVPARRVKDGAGGFVRGGAAEVKCEAARRQKRAQGAPGSLKQWGVSW